MKHFIHQLRRVKAKEVFQIWKLPIALCCAVFYKMFHKDLWIICEDKNEARDNGYWFFKYVINEHPEQECVYAISSKSPDFDKISVLGPWVEYGSLKHWILYIASSKKISSQKAGNPNAAIFYFMEVYGLIKNNRIFLGHGITINNAKWLYYNVTKMSRFICGAFPEYEYVSNNFGYPKGCIIYSGLCRFDGLHDYKKDENVILVMPSWREWIADEDYRLVKFEGTTDIPNTEYFRRWIDFLEDEQLQKILQDNNKRLVFYPHRNMQKYIDFFPESSDNIEIAKNQFYDVQDLMKKASLMITDYSSVFMDMIYMKKPVIFYQFDYEKFRKAQYEEGYFNYEKNPFAPCCYDKQNLLLKIQKCISDNFQVSEEYLNNHRLYFKLYDTKNCERIFDMIRQMR